jgi:amino acid transporter
VATATVHPEELASSAAPLSQVVSRSDWLPPGVFALVALFAVANTALLNFVMASRLAYGMADDALLPSRLALLHRSWRTPHYAILAILVLAVVLALSGGVKLLAGSTSFLLLSVFFVMNVALVRVRRSRRDEADGFRCPAVVPWTGMALSASLAFFLPPTSIVASLLVVAAGIAATAVLVGVKHRARRRS